MGRMVVQGKPEVPEVPEAGGHVGTLLSLGDRANSQPMGDDCYLKMDK